MDLARVAGVVWLLYFLTAIPGGILMGRSREVALGLSVLSIGFYAALTAVLYTLLERVDRSTALTAAFVSVIGLALTAIGTLLQTSPNTELSDLGKRAVGLAFPFFGFFMIATGSLIVRSDFLPQIFGAWFIAAGLAWVTFLVPPLFRLLQVGIIPFGGLAEVALMLWLIVRGIDIERWQQLLR